MERKRMEEAERERVRQQKRINFLLTQTELFAHFIGQKMGGITDDNNASRDAEPTPAPEAGEQTPALASKEEERLMAAKKKGQLDKGETREALASAQAALQNRQRAMQSFDEETREATKKLSKKDDTALVNSLDSAALQHTDVNLTAEAASIFNGTLKAYQKIGANV
jgi:DNA helicase INO80